MTTLDWVALIAGAAFVWLFCWVMLRAARGAPKSKVPRRDRGRTFWGIEIGPFSFWW